MSEELIQDGLSANGVVFGKYEYYNIGRTTIADLVKHNIIAKKDYGVYNSSQPDALIVDRRNKKNIQVIAVLEYKNTGELNNQTKINKALKQCNNYCEVLGAKIGVVTNGHNFIWINPQPNTTDCEVKYKDDKNNTDRGYCYINDENGNRLIELFDYNNTTSIEIIDKLLSVISKTNSSLKRANTILPSILAKQVWQSVWLATGDDPKKCLMTFTELFIYKFLSDLGILTSNEDGVPIDFNTIYKTGNDKCLKYYLANVRPYIKRLFPESDTDSTTIINGLSLKKGQNQDKLFYDILDSFLQYGELKNIDPSFKSRLFEDFLKGTTGKKQLAQFFTPRNVIKAIVDMADVKNLADGANVLDPSGGVGGFVIESIINRISNNKQDFSFDKKSKLTTRINYRSYDFDEITVILGKANLLLCLTEILEANPTLTVELSNLLHDSFQLTNKQIIGSLEKREENKYDLIMSNPPYVSKGLALYRNFIKENGLLQGYYNVSSVGKEGLFVQKIVNELKNNGRSKAFIVLPNGFFYRPADNELKKYILENCYLDCIISLPEKTFYATTKKTYVIGITKKQSKKDLQNHPVLCGIIKSIGEELSKDRIPIPDNDLLPFVSNYKMYNADKDNFKPFNKKIKLIDIDNFKKNFNWIIEQYWDTEEKIEIGIIEEEREVSDEDLFDNIEYFRSRLDNIKQELENRFIRLSENIKYYETDLLNKDLFELKTGILGFNRKEYSSLNTNNKQDIPIYTATKEPVAYIKPIKNTPPHVASKERPDISFASDGDGTAGKNIVLHESKYYLNTSRIAFSVIDEDILPKYIFYFIQDIKKKYGFDFKHKANINNVKEISISIPVDSNGNFDKELQQKFIDEYERLIDVKKSIMLDFFKKIDDFKEDIEWQLDNKFKEYFNI